MIGEPFELGTVHDMITFEPEVETVGGLGVAGLRAVITVISLLKGPSPNMLTATTLNQ